MFGNFDWNKLLSELLVTTGEICGDAPIKFTGFYLNRVMLFISRVFISAVSFFSFFGFSANPKVIQFRRSVKWKNDLIWPHFDLIEIALKHPYTCSLILKVTCNSVLAVRLFLGQFNRCLQTNVGLVPFRNDPTWRRSVNETFLPCSRTWI